MEDMLYQPDLETLKTITRPTHFILSGYLKGSLTFKIYTLGMQHFNINANYYPYELPLKNNQIDRKSLSDFLNVFRNNHNLQTIIVSCPYKQIMLDYMDNVSLEAKNIGGINFVLKKNNQLWGEHHDAEAFLVAVENEIQCDFTNSAMLFFGCGGVSSAIALKLASRLKKIGLVDIDQQKVQSLSVKLKRQYPHISVMAFDRSMPANFSEFDVFYNGTGLGKDSTNPLSINDTPVFENDIFPSAGIAIDANYRPRETAFLKNFTKREFTTLNGFGHMIASSAIHLSMMSNTTVEFMTLKTIVSEHLSLPIVI